MADSIRVILDQAGSTEAELVDYLRAQGIKGQMQNVWGCPLANLISANRGIETCIMDWRVWEGEPFAPMPIADLKEHEVNFYRHFDQGEYPDLIQGDHNDL